MKKLLFIDLQLLASKHKPLLYSVSMYTFPEVTCNDDVDISPASYSTIQKVQQKNPIQSTSDEFEYSLSNTRSKSELFFKFDLIDLNWLIFQLDK